MQILGERGLWVSVGVLYDKYGIVLPCLASGTKVRHFPRCLVSGVLMMIPSRIVPLLYDNVIGPVLEAA